MAQISPGDGTIDPTVTDGTDLAARLERFYSAEASQNSGPSRPATLAAGGIWCKTGAANSPELYMYDGTKDVLIMDKNGTSKGVEVGATRPPTLAANSVWIQTGGTNSPEFFLYDGTNDILIVDKNGMSTTLDDVVGNGDTTTKAITVGQTTVTGDLTVDTNTLYVDSTNNRVGIGTASPSEKLSVFGGNLILNDIANDVGIKMGPSSVEAYIGYVGASGNLQITPRSGYNTVISSGNVGIGTADTGNAGLSVSKADVSNNVYSRINGVATANEAGLQFADQNTLKWTIVKPGSSNDLVFYNHTGPSEAMRIDSSGNLLVGKKVASPSLPALSVDVAGQVWSAGAQITSDGNLKSSVNDYAVDLSAIKGIKSKKYIKNGKEEVGVIAQDVEAVFPDAVTTSAINDPDADIDTWTSAGNYTEGQQVKHKGKVYRALADVQTGIQPDGVWTPATDDSPAVGGWEPIRDVWTRPIGTDGQPMMEQKYIDMGAMNAIVFGAMGQMVEKIEALEARIAALESN